MDEVERAKEALFTIPPSLPRGRWHEVGRAAIAAGLTVEDILEWSRPADNFKSERDVYSAFRGVTAEGGTGPGTLFKIASDYGYVTRRNDVSAASRQIDVRRSGHTNKQVSDPELEPALLWGRFEPAGVDHPYIVAKSAQGVPLHSLKVVPCGDPLRIMGERMSGALVLPVTRPDGTISSLQFIPPPGANESVRAKGRPSKLNLPGAMLDGWLTVGDIVPDGVIYVCEGIGAAWSCWQSTGSAAVVCFGWGRVQTVSQGLRVQYPLANLVLIPDAGKEKSADEIAIKLNCAVAHMPSGEKENFDANDLAQRDGNEALARLLETARKPPGPELLLKPVSVCDVLTNPAPPPDFVWDGYLPRGVVSLWGAHGGTGKSTAALMLSVAVATGKPLFGVPTVPGVAVFISLEDCASIVRHRLAGICRALDIDPVSLHDALHIFDGTENPELFSATSKTDGSLTATYDELMGLIERTKAGLVVVDNASDAFGGDEIQRRQVRSFMRALGMVARKANCAVVLLAHVDKATIRNKKSEGDEGYSGSTAWHNSARSRLFMSRGGDGKLTLEHQKSNFGKRRDPITLEWPEGGLPRLSCDGFGVDGLHDRTQGRIEDEKAAALLRLIAEFEGRSQYCSTSITARNHPFAVLQGEPAFKRLSLKREDVRRIVNQCQRAKWIEPLIYRTPDRKDRERWTLTASGRDFASISAPTAPTAPTVEDGAIANMAQSGAPTAPTCVGGMGESARASGDQESWSTDDRPLALVS